MVRSQLRAQHYDNCGSCAILYSKDTELTVVAACSDMLRCIIAVIAIDGVDAELAVGSGFGGFMATVLTDDGRVYNSDTVGHGSRIFSRFSHGRP